MKLKSKKGLSTLFEDREIICVSSTKLSSKKIGKISYFIGILLFSWFVISTFKFFQYREIIRNKNAELENLWAINKDLKSDLNVFSSSIDSLKNYIVSLNNYDRFKTVDTNDNYLNTYLAKIDTKLSDKYLKEAKNVLERTTENTTEIALNLDKRIKGVEGFIKNTGIGVDPSNFYTASFEDDIDIDTTNSDDTGLVNKNIVKEIKEKVDYLSYLEDFLNKLPIGEPIENYYVSSKYGVRGDPFTGDPRPHMALDLVGAYDSKIHAPSAGKVIAAGNTNGYGNYLIIDHGYGIRTEYAHMKQVLVKEKQEVTRGEVIGIQGTTGRSTGQHLHFVVKEDGSPVNPTHFLEVGKRLF